jgi:hypothetical protein
MHLEFRKDWAVSFSGVNEHGHFSYSEDLVERRFGLSSAGVSPAFFVVNSSTLASRMPALRETLGS